MTENCMAPYVNWLFKQEDDGGAVGVESAERNINFVVAHFGFFLFNVMNVSYILSIEWYARQRLQSNGPLKLVLVACFMQILSCLSSITRFNIDDEYGFYGQVGVFTGVAAYACMNIPYLRFIFQDNSRMMNIGRAAWPGIAIVVAALSHARWAQKRFLYFRGMIFISDSTQAIVLWVFSSRLESGAVEIDTSIIGKDPLSRMSKVLAVVDAIGLAVKMVSKMPVLQYPLSGVSFTITVLLVSITGRMEILHRNDIGVSNEGTSLKANEGAV